MRLLGALKLLVLLLLLLLLLLVLQMLQVLRRHAIGKLVVLSLILGELLLLHRGLMLQLGGVLLRRRLWLRRRPLLHPLLIHCLYHLILL